MSTKEQVQEAVLSLSHIARMVTITHPSTDVQERDLITNFLSTGRGCVIKCSSQFTTEHVTSVRASCTELSHSKLDMTILGQLMAFVNTSSIVSTAARHKEDECKAYTSFSHQGKPIYHIWMFRFLHSVGSKQLKNLMKSLKVNSLAPRVQGNT